MAIEGFGNSQIQQQAASHVANAELQRRNQEQDQQARLRREQANVQREEDIIEVQAEIVSESSASEASQRRRAATEERQNQQRNLEPEDPRDRQAFRQPAYERNGQLGDSGRYGELSLKA